MRPPKGFLLLEVILTVLLVAGGLLVVTMSFSVSKKILLKSRELFESTLLLQEKSSEIQVKGNLEGLAKSGSWQDPPAEWSLEVSALPETELSHVTLEVFLPHKQGTGETVETYLWKKSS